MDRLFLVGVSVVELGNMKGVFRTIIRAIAMQYGMFRGLYIKTCRPRGDEYAKFLMRHGSFYGIGQKCSILPSTTFTDPEYVRIGSNVRFSKCTVIGHDGSIAMLSRAYNVQLDSVGKVDIRDNVYIGWEAIVMPNVTIGPNAIVAAGAVVTRDVPEGHVVAGVPAKSIGLVEDLVKKLQNSTRELPWADLIYQREGGFDAKLEPELLKKRISHFYGEDE